MNRMYRSAHNSKSGFTLIELSIVLIIIGLTIGGTLVGRELIQSAEIRSAVTQLERIETAVNSFRVKYGCMPGDCVSAGALGFEPTLLSSAAPMPSDSGSFSLIASAYAQECNPEKEKCEEEKKEEECDPKLGCEEPKEEEPKEEEPKEEEPEEEGASSVGPNGNGDGKYLTADDSAMLFDQLFQSGFLENTNQTHVYLPISAGNTSGKAYWKVEYRNSNGNYFVPVSGTGVVTYNTLTPATAYRLDKGKDDGNPVQGKVAALTSAGARVAGGDKGAAACVSASDSYNASLSGSLCGLEIKTSF